MKYKLTFALLLGFKSILGFGQCTNQVTHFSGNQTINGIDVNVTSLGMVEYNDVYCLETFPYLIGFNLSNGNGDGSFTFTFSPPVDSLTLNFGGISNIVPAGAEFVSLFINDIHYEIPNVGIINNCGEFAVLTTDGNITGCTNCNGSGWNDTTIEGPISTLTVTNTIITGFPNGSIFSLFICDPILGNEENIFKNNYTIYPNPFSQITTIETEKILSNVEIILYNSLGQKVKELNNLFGNLFTINRDNLSNGLYFLKLKQGETTLITDRLIIN
jgi:hypothetical protein